MTDYFEDLLSVLFDTNRELNPSQLSELSDPTRENLIAFRSAWFAAHQERRLEISRHLFRLAEENIELLFERINLVLLDDTEPAIRQQAIRNLWETENPQLARRLAAFSRQDPSPEVKEESARALARFVLLGEMEKLPPGLYQEIVATLMDLLAGASSDPIKQQALESLGYSSNIDLKENIRDAYHSENEDYIRSSLVAMGRTADPDWREEIEARLNHPAPRIRAEAARAIGEIQSRRSVEGLLDLLDDTQDPVREAAIWSLGQVGGQEAREALEKLAEGIHDGVSRDSIEEALEHIAFLESTPDLLMFETGNENE